jgi:hypothetical protein
MELSCIASRFATVAPALLRCARKAPIDFPLMQMTKDYQGHVHVPYRNSQLTKVAQAL